METRILIADGHKIFREGLRALLNNEPDLEVEGEADNGRTLVRLTMRQRPNVVITEVGLSELNGIEATRQILTNEPRVRVMVLTANTDRRFVTHMLNAGASGYLLKSCGIEELVRAIHTVVAHRTYLTPEVTAEFIRDSREWSQTTGFADAFVLTSRKREVLQLLAEGKATKEIARLLYISVKTVETHRKQIMDRLDLHSVAALTKYALREGITSLEN